jgi:hypothetical protein
MSGSSSSDSGGGAGDGEALGCWAFGILGTGCAISNSVGAVADKVGVSTALGLGGGAGVSSTVLCLPVVQGGMERNSSKVR